VGDEVEARDVRARPVLGIVRTLRHFHGSPPDRRAITSHLAIIIARSPRQREHARARRQRSSDATTLGACGKEWRAMTRKNSENELALGLRPMEPRDGVISGVGFERHTTPACHRCSRRFGTSSVRLPSIHTSHCLRSYVAVTLETTEWALYLCPHG
jgi:hypothetical protein